jgi:glutamate-1-semialdehyde 2,1-aminomutase
VPAAFTQHTIVLPFNDTDAVRAAFAANTGQIAGIILEPVPGNAGLYKPKPGYLDFLREITAANGALLIFDEVMTGFRVAAGGAQQIYGVTPDLTTLGKVIGGGLPIAAYGGRQDVMAHVAPGGPIYQAGTLSGNPLAVNAGLAMLRYIQAHPEIYKQFDSATEQLAASAPKGVTVNRAGSMMTWFFTPAPVTDYDTAKHSETSRFKRFFHAMIERGIYLPPSQFEAMFVSTAHSHEDLRRTADAAKESFAIAND